MSCAIRVRIDVPEVGDRFAPGAFDSRIGTMIKVNDSEGIVRAAEVAADGSHALVTVEVPGGPVNDGALVLSDSVRPGIVSGDWRAGSPLRIEYA